MGSNCIWDGTLSLDGFQIAARALSERWREINPNLPEWMWIPCPALSSCDLREAEGYLSLENVYHFNLTEIQNKNQEIHIYDFHIIYSFSYKVPVLYFRGYQCDGQPLGPTDIQKDLPFYSLSILKESKWSYITMEEHPFLHRPWYMLHPCGTSDWMKLLFGDTLPMKEQVIQQYLPSWLSVVGQAVGLRIPLEMQNKFPSTSLSTVTTCQLVTPISCNQSL